MTKPIAVWRCAGKGPHGLATRFGDSLTPHADERELRTKAREQGWRNLIHRPFGEPQRGDKMDADTVADQIDSGGTGLVSDFIFNADPSDLHYWGTVDSADLAALWDANPPEFYRRLALAAWVIGKAGGTPILDAAGASDHPANHAWIEMVRAASGVEPVLEPLVEDNIRRMHPGFALERWYFDRVVIGSPGSSRYFRGDDTIRWWSGHKLADGALPWGGLASHWLRQVTSHGHTPAMNYEDIDLSVTAEEFLEATMKGTA